MSARVLIIGGGISGIATAWWLAQEGVPVEVWEARDRIGGLIQSERRDGFLIEPAAALLLNFRPEVSELIRASGLEDRKRQRSGLASRNRYLSIDGALRKMPNTAAQMLFGSTWSLGARLRMLGEPFIPGRPDDAESVSDFIRRRLGGEILESAIEPFVAGTLAADPDLANARATLPRLTALERRYGSLTMGVIWHKLIRRRTAHVTEAFSFDGGMSDLVHGLAEHPLIRVRPGRPVRNLRRDGRHWWVESDRYSRRVSQVVLAGSTHATETLLRPRHGDVADVIADIPQVPMNIVHLGFRRDQVRHALDGSGFLSSRAEGCAINGNLWMSSLFPGRAPQGHVLLSSYVGGARHPESRDLDDDALIEMAMAELKPRLNLQGSPSWYHVHRHDTALPVYHGPHFARVNAIQQAMGKIPGLHVCGNYLDGVSVRDRLIAGRGTARAIARELVTREESPSSLIRAAGLGEVVG